VDVVAHEDISIERAVIAVLGDIGDVEDIGAVDT